MPAPTNPGSGKSRPAAAPAAPMPAQPVGMLVGVDGTGAQDWGPQDICRSFVNKIVHQSGYRYKFYLRGPDGGGFLSRGIADRALLKIDEWVAAGGNTLVLTGYSRGGVISLDIADHVSHAHPHIGIGMALFDAVDRQIGMHYTIRGNVDWVHHAMRNPATFSRPYMLNCATEAGTARQYDATNVFFASHAGLGGMPWDAVHDENYDALHDRFTLDNIGRKNQNRWGYMLTKPLDTPRDCVVTREADEEGSRQVGVWMWKRLIGHGVLPAGAVPSARAPVPPDTSYTTLKEPELVAMHERDRARVDAIRRKVDGYGAASRGL